MQRDDDPCRRAYPPHQRDEFQADFAVVVQVHDVRHDPLQQEGELVDQIGRLREQEVIENLC